MKKKILLSKKFIKSNSHQDHNQQDFMTYKKGQKTEIPLRTVLCIPDDAVITPFDKRWGLCVMKWQLYHKNLAEIFDCS